MPWFDHLSLGRSQFSDEALEEAAERLRSRGTVSLSVLGAPPQERAVTAVRVTSKGLEYQIEVSKEEWQQLSPESSMRVSAGFSVSGTSKEEE